MKTKYIAKISLFLLTIFISLALLPNLNMYTRPNLILIFLVFMLVEESFLVNLPFWFIGGIGLDIWRTRVLGASSFTFIGLLILGYILSKFVDFKEKETKIIIGGLFILLYHLSLFFVFWWLQHILSWNILVNGVISVGVFLFICFVISKYFNYYNA